MALSHVGLAQPRELQMVDMGKNLGIPEPFGPRLRACAAWKKTFASCWSPWASSALSLMTFDCYLTKIGAFCACANIRWVPFAFKWWRMVP